MERPPKPIKDQQTREEAKADRVDHPDRHPSHARNQQVAEVALEEQQSWWETEGQTDTTHLGS